MNNPLLPASCKLLSLLLAGLWSLALPAQENRKLGTDEIFYSIAISPDSTLLAAAGQQGVQLWNWQQGSKLAQLEDAPCTTLAYAHGIHYLATGNQQGQIRMWDTRSRQLLWTQTPASGVITCMAFSHDDQWVALGSTDQHIYVLHVQSGQLKTRLQGHQDDVLALDFAPDGRILASGGADQSLKLWDVGTGELLHTIPSQQGWIHDLTYSTDGTRLLSSGDKGRLMVWKVDPNAYLLPLTNLHKSMGWLLSVSFEHPGKNVYGTAGQSGKLFIFHPYGYYAYRGNSLIHDFCFLPRNEDNTIQVAIATRGEGILLLHATQMKSYY
ncbi:MAG: WD40 repeat domain-containing protein [Bacteroidetes bacterium]|nr:MAG: WD40 repeat domain-containing protein [Bacteroidota bacterium]